MKNIKGFYNFINEQQSSKVVLNLIKNVEKGDPLGPKDGLPGYTYDIKEALEQYNNIPLNDNESGVDAIIIPDSKLEFSIGGKQYSLIFDKSLGLKPNWKGKVNLDTTESLFGLLDKYEIEVSFRGGKWKDTNILKSVANKDITKIIQLINTGGDGSEFKVLMCGKHQDFILVDIVILREK